VARDETYSLKTKPTSYVTCVCGQVCKGRAAHANHGRKCPEERARSEAFIAAVHTRDWTAYNARYGGSRS
jgi:hypothetical protein